MNLILCSNWTFGTTELITLLGTIATFSAVIIALWQTTSSRKKKLKLQLSFVMTVNPLTEESNEYLNLSVANTGLCPVKLANWYIFIEDIKICIINTPILGTTNTSFPLFLNPTEDGTFFLEKHKFLKAIVIEFKDKLLKTNKIKTGCYLSTGELKTTTVKVSTLFNKQNIKEVYDEIDTLNIK